MLTLVNYSDSGSDDCSDESADNDDDTERKKLHERKRKRDDDAKENSNEVRKLPLPKSIDNMFPRKDTEDNVTRHNGRKRTFDHFEGNWPTYIFIPLNDSPNVQEIYDKIIRKVSDNYGSDMHPFDMDMCHITVSRTVPIRHYWITPIFDKLKEMVAGKKKFYYSLGNVRVYTNDEETRTFVGLEVSTGHKHFEGVVEKTNRVYAEFNLEKYYECPSFHVSIAWLLGNKKEELERYLSQNKSSIMAAPLSGISHQLADKICMKTGNKVFQIALD